MNRTPIEILRLGTERIRVVWSDKSEIELTAERLRRNCPCAECREARGEISHSAPLAQTKPSSLRVIESSTEEELRIDKIFGVGNYAIGISWGDGHDSGIYSYGYLEELGRKSA